MRRTYLALIPAHGGSKGIPRKNLQLVGGHPLVAWAIAAAQQVPAIGSVVVSSDDQDILDVAVRYGAEPLVRPAFLAGDAAGDVGVIHHARRAMRWLDHPIVYLRPTTPLRDPRLLLAAIAVWEQDPEATALRSVEWVPESPFKWYGTNGGKWLQPVNQTYEHQPRQACPPVWAPNGYIDIVRECRYGQRIVGFGVRALEIDGPAQLHYCRYELLDHPSPLQGVLNAAIGH